MIGVVGAFTPRCTEKHLPEFLPYWEELHKNNVVDEIACVCVADPFVLRAWSEALGTQGRITMLTDTNATFAKDHGLAVDLSELGLGLRSTRYLLFVNDGVVEIANVEEKPSDIEQTSAETAYKLLVAET